MQRRPALVVRLVHGSTLLHQEAHHLQVLIYAGLRAGTGSSAPISPEAQQGHVYKGRPGNPGPVRVRRAASMALAQLSGLLQPAAA